MKRRMAILAMLGLAAAAFADSAQVLAKDTLQATVAATYGTASQEYNADGEKANITKISTINLGAALRFGLMDGVNVELEWIPGVNVWSKYEDSDYHKLSGVYDLFLGAKLQLWGEKGLIGKNKQLRLAFTPGFIFAMPGPDYEKQVENAATLLNPFVDDENYTMKDVDRHAMAAVGRLSFDYVLSPEFCVNLFTEYDYFFKTNKTSFLSPSTEHEYEYGYALTFEAEPQYSKKIAGGKTLKASLPLTYTLSPEYKVDGSAVDGSDTFFLTIAPKLGIVLAGSSPLELDLCYTAPLAGKNVNVTNSFSVLAKVGLKL
jgi:hypothetical protein